MQYTLTTVSATDPLGHPHGRNLFEVPSGTYAGRLAAICQTSPTELKLFQADNPYSDWSTVQSIDSACDNEPFDACLDDSNNLHLVYTEQTTGYLKYRMLSFSSGTWSIGSAQTIYNQVACFSPSVSIEPDGKLWVAFTIYNAPNRDLYAKSSIDGGATWGTGTTDPGTLIRDGYIFIYPRLITALDKTFIFYNSNYSYLSCKTLAHGGTTWSSQISVASGGNISAKYDVALGPNGVIGIAWDDLAVYYREFDGANWGAVTQIENSLALGPQVQFRSGYPIVIYAALWHTGNYILKYSHRQTGTFSTPEKLGVGDGTLDNVIIYDPVSGQYDDLTTEAASSSTSDVYHSQTGVLLRDTDETLFLGLDQTYRSIYAYLPTAGVGGVLEYSYWDGTAWKVFTPFAGNANLDTASSRVTLFDDLSSIPNDWQKCIVEGGSRFWIRVRVTSGYSTGPIGSSITAYPYVANLSFSR